MRRAKRARIRRLGARATTARASVKLALIPVLLFVTLARIQTGALAVRIALTDTTVISAACAMTVTIGLGTHARRAGAMAHGCGSLRLGWLFSSVF